MEMKFNGVELTEETIKRTVQHFIEIHERCIEEVGTGRTRVNDPFKYIKDEELSIEMLKEGELRNNLTFLQRAYWIQTGEMVALLP